MAKSPTEKPGPSSQAFPSAALLSKKAPGSPRGYDYSRSGNPTREALEKNIASLEMPDGEEAECYGLAFASGLGASANILFALLNQGDHLICSDDVYGGTFRLITGKDYKGYEKFGVECDYVDMGDEETLAGKIKENTKLIWIETPHESFAEDGGHQKHHGNREKRRNPPPWWTIPS